MSFAHIIVGLGPSPSSERVERFAAALADGLAARLVRVHAGPVDPAVARRPGVQTRPGPPAAALQNEAEHLASDLIVVGSGARDDGPELGATTTSLLRMLTVPLLVVPTHGPDLGPPSWRRLLVPVDFTPEGDIALGFMKALAARLGSELVLVHVVSPPLPVSDPSVSPLTEAPAELVSEAANAREELAATARRAGLGQVHREVVEATHPWEGIAEVARRIHAGFVAMPAHGRGRVIRFLVGSTTERLLRIADTPVLVFPPAWVAEREAAAGRKRVTGD